MDTLMDHPVDTKTGQDGPNMPKYRPKTRDMARIPLFLGSRGKTVAGPRVCDAGPG